MAQPRDAASQIKSRIEKTFVLCNLYCCLPNNWKLPGLLMWQYPPAQNPAGIVRANEAVYFTNLRPKAARTISPAPINAKLAGSGIAVRMNWPLKEDAVLGPTW